MQVYEGTPDFDLLMQASEALSLNQTELAQLLALSRRTISRYVRQRSCQLTVGNWAKLAGAVHAKNPTLAAALAEKAGGTLVSLGIVPPPPPPTPAKPADAPANVTPPSKDQLDLLVFAAAEAANLSPQAVRPVVAAVFTKAASMGVTVDAVSAAMTPAKVKKSS
jgi:hypothetical protein